RRKRTPISAACPEGDSDAHSGFGNFRDRGDRGGGTGAGTNLRSQLSGLPACLWQDHLLRMQLYLAAPVQHVGVGPFGAMRDQSVLCPRTPATIGAALQALPPQLLKPGAIPFRRLGRRPATPAGPS